MKIIYNEESLTLADNLSGKDLAEHLQLLDPSQAITLSVNGQITDLDTQLKDGDHVKLLDFSCSEGKEVFWHTSAHVLAQAILRLWPDAQPTIGPPIEIGFYYDFANLSISDSDFKSIEKEIKNILKENFKTEKHTFNSREEALEVFKNNPYKKDLINSFDPSVPLTGYRQGEFFDLCRGPHLPSIGKIKAFKLLKISGAYWRGDSSKPMLTRIYGISFPDREILKTHLHMLEEAKKRDHRRLGTQLNLFSFKEEAPAMPFFHHHGMIIWDRLTTYWKEIHTAFNYEIIQTPQLLTRDLWERSGHWNHYQDNMFIVEASEERSYALKPMNCPGCMLHFKSRSHSYRELPLRIAEFGHVHRKEPSGALNGLFRVQSFHQDDAHIFMTIGQIKEEIIHVLDMVKQIYETFGLTYTFELSTRPEKSIGNDEAWELTTKALKGALDEWNATYVINEGDGAFYGPKIDLHVHDALNRKWQCGTVQLDMALPEAFKLEYKSKEGHFKRPIMIHRAIFGSIERFLGILIEHFAGKFPLWMSPYPICVIPVAQAHCDYAHAVTKAIKKSGLGCICNTSNESLGKKIRQAQLLKTNYMLTIGDQEIANQSATLRTRDNIVHGEIFVEDFIKKCQLEYSNKHLKSSY